MAESQKPQTPAQQLLNQLPDPAAEWLANGLWHQVLDKAEVADLKRILESHDALVAALTDLMAAPTMQDTVDRLAISTTPMVRSRAQAALRLALEHR